jgi:hypothetical protein
MAGGQALAVTGRQTTKVWMVRVMNERKYYSVRTGNNHEIQNIDLDMLKRLIQGIYLDFKDRYYFQEAFGFNCFDAGFVPGKTGHDTEVYVFRKLRKSNLWPFEEKIENYSEDDLFDIIELMFDLISKPLEGRFHDWNDCGWHYSTFDKMAGQLEFLTEINPQLNDYTEGYELSSDGEILLKGSPGLQVLLSTEIPEHDPKNIDDKIKYAVLKFRRHRASVEDIREAVRTLADVLEYLRPQIKQLPLTKDEAEIFNIANNFGIRHHNSNQKTDYDQEVYLEWIFYSYLSTIYLLKRIILSH